MISLTKNQLVNVMVSIILIRLYLSFPRELLIGAGNAAWLLVIFLSILAFILFYAIL